MNYVDEPIEEAVYFSISDKNVAKMMKQEMNNIPILRGRVRVSMSKGSLKEFYQISYGGEYQDYFTLEEIYAIIDYLNKKFDDYYFAHTRLKRDEEFRKLSKEQQYSIYNTHMYIAITSEEKQKLELA